MKKSLSRIALGFGVALLVSSAAILLLVPGSTRVAVVEAIAGILLVGVYFAVNKGALGRTFGGKATMFYGVSAAIAVVLAGALGAANYVAAKKKVSWDLTKAGLFTLAEDTTRTLQGLTDEVKVTAYYGSADPEFPGVKEMLDRYQKQSDKLVVEYVDPEKEPQRAKAASITAHGPRIVFSHGATEARANDASEEALTNALVKVLRTSEKKVYFTTGHGEADLKDEATEFGYARIAKKLEDEGLRSSTVNLLGGSIPDDAAALVIVGPRKPFMEPEVEAISDWLDEGGRLFVALEPGFADPGLEKLLEEWGVIFEDSLVVDPLSKLMGGGDAVPVVQHYAEHDITKGFGLTTVFPTARPVIARGDADPRPTILALTNPTAWGETDYRSGNAQFDEGERRGSLGLVAIAARTKEGAETESRIVATGDADFVNNKYLAAAGNADLFLNSMNWLASQEARITIRPKMREASHLMLTDADAKFLNFFSISAMPMLILAAGLSVWLVRRSK
ncbi:MAG TPA: GldG family protein [Vulgatibacter sp.]|nr:GldG family protein [Vulgatibacter sp.]